MEINLGFIEGISRTDTPYFNDREAQESYFDSHKIVTVETTFYPPHYNNEIRFDKEDLSFDTQVNYLWFEFDNRIYYYFIDDITYISEEVISLFVTMDTIQTYLFDIKVEHGIVERALIERYKPNGDINRDYIREEVSEGNYHVVNKTYLYSTQYWLVLKFKSVRLHREGLPSDFQTHYFRTYMNGSNGKTFSAFGYAFYPIGSNIAYYKCNDDAEKQPLEHNLMSFLTNIELVDAYIVDYNPYPSLFEAIGDTLYVYRNKDRTINVAYGLAWIYDSYVKYVDYYLFMEYPSNVRTGTYRYGGFTQNDWQYRSFDIKYNPVLWDENFIKITYGNESSILSYPLRTMRDNEIAYSNEFCLSDGSSIYKTAAYLADIDINYYSTTIIDTNIMSFDIMNDAYSEYVANNRNRWASVGLQVAAEGAESILSMVTGYGKLKAGLEAIRTNPKNWDRRTTKNPRLKQGAIKDQNNLYNNSVMKATSDIPLLEMFMPSLNQVMTDVNYMMKPPTVKQIGVYQSGIQSRNKQIFIKVERVNDIEKCARYFETNGYLLEHQKDSSMLQGLMWEYGVRYYFNILKMKQIDITIFNCIQDNITCENIKDRLLDGIRYWNMEDSNYIGNFYYDNVEKANLPS